MCQIIYSPKGTFPVNEIDDAVLYNSDGYGLIDIKSGTVFRSLKFSKIESKLYSIQGPWALHCRLSTQGTVSRENCHPFVVGDYAVMMNGMISGIRDNGVESDTAQVVSFIKHMPNNEVLKYLQMFSNVRWFVYNMRTKKTHMIGRWQKEGDCFYSAGPYRSWDCWWNSTPPKYRTNQRHITSKYKT